MSPDMANCQSIWAGRARKAFYSYGPWDCLSQIFPQMFYILLPPLSFWPSIPHLLLHTLGPPLLLCFQCVVSVHIHVGTWASVWRPEVDGRWLLYHSQPCHWDKVSHWAWSPLIQLDGITNGLQSPACLSSNASAWGFQCLPSFYLPAGDPNSGHYTSTARMLLAAISWVWNPCLWDINFSCDTKNRTQGRTWARQASTTYCISSQGTVSLHACFQRNGKHPPTTCAEKNQK